MRRLLSSTPVLRLGVTLVTILSLLVSFICIFTSRLALRCGWLAASGLLLLPRLGFLCRGFCSLLSQLWLLSLLLLDIIQGHANNGLLELLRPPGALLACLISFTLLVHASPCLSPTKLHWLDPLIEEGFGLRVDEVMHLTILCDRPLTVTRIDTVLSVWADVGLDNHCAEMWSGDRLVRKREL